MFVYKNRFDYLRNKLEISGQCRSTQIDLKAIEVMQTRAGLLGVRVIATDSKKTLNLGFLRCGVAQLVGW